MIADSQAWAIYWREVAAAEIACAPNSPGIAAATSHVWREHGRALPPRPTVLDLATGNGAVLLHVRSVRTDAELIGVDSAPDLGRLTERGLSLMPSVRMEALPFGNCRFDTVTSQFGFEYGDTGAIAREVARVLRPAGSLRLLIHHRNSPVVAQGRVRRGELQWVLAPGSLLDQAVNYAATRMLTRLPLLEVLRAGPSLAAERFGQRSAAAEIMTGILQVLEYGGPNAPALLGRLKEKVAAELARLNALLDAARDEAGSAAIRDQLQGVGLTMAEARPIRETTDGMTFAWLLDGTRD